jgi:orotate phosphoribosyltransferase
MNLNVNLIDGDIIHYQNGLWGELGIMASQVNVNGKTLHDILWNPSLYGIEYARDISALLQEAHDILKSDKPKYKAFNPENRKGTFTGLCVFVDDYKNACLHYPNAKLQVYVQDQYDALNFKEDRVSQLMKTLHKNRAIRFVNGRNKLMQPIPYDFRIDRCCSAEHMEAIGELMGERVLQIEKQLNVKFDSIFCSLFSGIFIGVSVCSYLYRKYNRNLKVSISRRSYKQLMGESTGTETFITSVHQLKNKTLVGELGQNVLVFDEMTNTGHTIRELINISTLNGVKPKAAMIIADRILDPLLQIGEYIRMYEDIPCYSNINHLEMVKWCEDNPEIWNHLYEDIYDNQNKFSDEELQKFEQGML